MKQAPAFLLKSPRNTARRSVRRELDPMPASSFKSGHTSSILQLQRTLGNGRLAQLIQAKRLTPEGRIIGSRLIGGGMSGIQPKLTVGAADDQYEQEADRIARQVMSMPDAAGASPDGSVQRAGLPEEKSEEDKDKLLQPSPLDSLGTTITPLAQQPQRQPEEEEAEKEAALQRSSLANTVNAASDMQRQAEMEEDQDQPIQPDRRMRAKPEASLSESFEAGEEVESRLNGSKGGGSPLSEAVRSFMEPRFGMDFSQVRAHTGADSVQMNRNVGARAFTHGVDIYYGAGQSPEDLALTAHELTHVVQQTGGASLQAERKVEAEQASLSPSFGASLQRVCSACEAEKKEKNILSGQTGAISRSPGGTPGNTIQRDNIPHGTLTWDDFQGDVPKKAKYDAATASFFEDPDLKALIPANAAVDTGEPCRAKGKDQTRFTVDITIDAAQAEVKSFMDQEKSWHKPWTTDEPARREKCEKDFSSQCEKAFKKQFSKIKKTAAKEKSLCQKDFGKMEKDAKKQCKPAVSDCNAAFKNGDPSFTEDFDGTEVTANTKKECTKVLLPGCVAASMEGQEFTRTLGSESATATTKAECKTKFAPELEALLKDEITWEATMSGASTTVSKPEDCRTTLLDACATDLMQAGSDGLLKHEQTHFDLTEAMAQKAQSDLRSLVDGFPAEVDACGQKAAEAKAKKTLASELKKLKKSYAANKKLLKKKQSQYDKETKHGTVEKKQAAWEEKISEGF